MAKSTVIKQLANDEIGLETALRRLMIISSDIGNDELYSWSVKELNGYNKEDDVPKYRIIKSANIKYSGVNGSYIITNQPLPLTYFPEKDWNDIMINKFRQGVGTLVHFISKENSKIELDLTHYAGHIAQKSGIKSVSITQEFSTSDFQQILDSIKTLLLEIYIKLDKTLGCLDDQDIEPGKKEQKDIDNMNADISRLIYYDGQGEEI